MIAQLVACCAAHQIDIVGPPISLAKDAGSGSDRDADISIDR
jgi:hypothetical protein